MSKKGNKLAQAHAHVASTLVGLEKMFQPQCLLTFIMRDPKDKDAYMFVSTDDENSLIDLLQRAKADSPVSLSSEQILLKELGLL